MYRSEIVTFSATETTRDKAIREATRLANLELSTIAMEEVLNYHIQTIHEPGTNGEDGQTEYYTHIISIVFRRRNEARTCST